MRAAALAVLFAFALLPTAAADTAIPDPPCPAEDLCDLPATGPLALELQFMVSREHSCSQSWESTSDFGTLAIRIDGGGEATLSVESTHSNVFGSHRERGGGPTQPPERRREETRFTWIGRAKREPGVLRLSMKARSASPVEMDRRPSIDIECRPARLPVTRITVAKEGQDATSANETARVLLCKSPSPILTGLEVLVEAAGGLPLGRAGFGLSKHDFTFNHGGLYRYQGVGQPARRR